MANTHSQAVRVLRRRAGARTHLTTVHRSILPEAKNSPSAGSGRPFSGDPAAALGMRPEGPRIQLPARPLERIPTAPPARHTIVLDTLTGELHFRDEESDPHPLDRLQPSDIAWDFPSAIAPAQQVNIATELESLFQDVLDAKFRGEDVAAASEAVAGALSQAEGDLRFYDADGFDPELGWQAVDRVLGLMDERETAAAHTPDETAIDRNGRDRRGFNQAGWNRRGLNSETGTKFDSGGFNRDGYDQDGRDRGGFNRRGKNHETGTKFDAEGYNRNGYGQDGFDRDGLNKWGLKHRLFHRDTFLENGSTTSTK